MRAHFKYGKGPRAALKWLLAAFCFVLLLAAVSHAQRTNTQYVDQLPGATVAAKTAAAQAACNPAIPCVLIFDSDLSAYPQGSMPARGANESWWDYTHPGQTLYNGAVVNSGGGTTVNNFSVVSHQFLNSFTAPNFTAAQPAFSDISGNIAVAQVNGGSGASSSTYFRGDNTWAALPNMPLTVATFNQTGLTADVAQTTMYTAPANGRYRFVCYTVVTVTATSGTLPGCNVIFTDVDSNTSENFQASTTGSTITLGHYGNTSAPNGLLFGAKSGTTISISTSTYASTPAATLTFAVHATLEYLGP